MDWASAGRAVCPAAYDLGALPTPSNRSADITALYIAKFGNPTAGKKVFATRYPSTAHFEQDFLCARKSIPAGASFHPQSSILHPLWLRLRRAAHICQTSNGRTDQPVQFSGIVPAGS